VGEAPEEKPPSEAGEEGQNKEKAQRQRGAWILIISAMFFVLVPLPRLWEGNPQTSAVGGVSLPTPSASPTTSAPPGATPDSDSGEDTDPAPSPRPSVIPPGTCLAVNHEEGGWGDRPTDAVGCGSAGAFYRVTDNVSEADFCPDDHEYSWLPYPAGGAACLAREFQVGQCMPATRTSGLYLRIDLRTSIDCDSDRVPKGRNAIQQITGVYRAPSVRRDRECSRTAYDTTVYWSWRVFDNKVLVCTAYVD
jgi:hypothetical protein